MSRTYMAKPLEVESKWYIIDAAGMPLGRVSSRVAAILKGKNKPQYTPNVDCGDHVIVINCNQVVLTGNKLDNKVYRAYSGFPGGLKETTFRKLLQEKADFAVLNAVKGMLPRTSLGRKQLKKLRVYKDANHNHQAQKPIALKFE